MNESVDLSLRFPLLSVYILVFCFLSIPTCSLTGQHIRNYMYSQYKRQRLESQHQCTNLKELHTKKAKNVILLPMKT
jgi:hypothetical protein